MIRRNGTTPAMNSIAEKKISSLERVLRKDSLQKQISFKVE